MHIKRLHPVIPFKIHIFESTDKTVSFREFEEAKSLGTYTSRFKCEEGELSPPRPFICLAKKIE